MRDISEMNREVENNTHEEVTMNTPSPTSSFPNHTDRCEPPYDDENPLPLMALYVLTVGLPANLITTVLTFLEVCRKNVLGIYLFSLSLCDLIYLSTLPLWAIYINRGHRWFWGSMACKVTGYVFFNNMYISIFLLCCVSVDRFVAVVYAVESRGLRKMKHAAIVTFVIVLVVALGHLPVFIMSEGETESTDEKRCFELALPSPLVTGFNYTRFVIGFFIPLCILIVTNLNILANVRASAVLEPRHKVKVRNLALAVISSFVVCFTPYHIILLLRAVSFHFSDEKCYFERTVYTPYTMSLGLSTINSAINPVFYVLTSNSVHMKIYQTLRGLRSSFRSSV